MRVPFERPDPPEVIYAEGRLPSRTYATRSFTTKWGRDAGHPSRYVHRVFDEKPTSDEQGADDSVEIVSTSPGGRKQLELHVSREAGAVRRLRIQRVTSSAAGKKTLENILELDRDQTARLLDMLRALKSIPADGDHSVYVDDQTLRDLFADPAAPARVYAANPELFRALVQADATAEDIIATQRRKTIVATMRAWLDDASVFDEAAAAAGGPEHAWQKLLEANTWILGLGLGMQLHTSWDPDRLEQTVKGADIQSVGKRVDALLRTAGVVSNLVFAEIKHHRTDLLGDLYRSGTYGPSKELGGAIAQVQQTVHLATESLTEYLPDIGDDGEQLATGTFLLRPQSYVIAGTLRQLTGATGGAILDRVRSFELFRRHLQGPQVITFDELVERAEWHVQRSAGAEDQTKHA